MIQHYFYCLLPDFFDLKKNVKKDVIQLEMKSWFDRAGIMRLFIHLLHSLMSTREKLVPLVLVDPKAPRDPVESLVLLDHLDLQELL